MHLRYVSTRSGLYNQLLTWGYSGRCFMGYCIFLQRAGLYTPCIQNDSPGFSAIRRNYGYDSVVSHILSCSRLSTDQSFHRFTANRLLLSPPSHSTPADSRVEWAYAFDVHTNAFFPFFLALYIAQLFLLKVVLQDNWICLWVGNTLYLAA